MRPLCENNANKWMKMFDTDKSKVQSVSPAQRVCECVCVQVNACVRVCACVCLPRLCCVVFAVLWTVLSLLPFPQHQHQQQQRQLLWPLAQNLKIIYNDVITACSMWHVA